AGGAGVALASCAAAKLVIDAAGLVAVGSPEEEAAGLGYFFLLTIGGDFVKFVNLVPFLGRNNELVARLVEERGLSVFPLAFDFALSSSDRLRNSLLNALLLRHELGVAAEQDVGSAAGHVRRDGDRSFASGLGHDFSFAFVELGVQDDVADALP